MISSMSTIKSWDSNLSAWKRESVQAQCNDVWMKKECHRNKWNHIFYLFFMHVYLIHDHHLDFIHLCHPLLHQVQDSPRCGNNHMHWRRKQKIITTVCRVKYWNNVFSIYFLLFILFNCRVDSYQSHPGAWCHHAGWCPQWWPWFWLLPGVCQSG